MNISILDVLTLDDNREYVVTRKTLLNGEIYLMIIDKQDLSNFKFVKYNNNEIEEIEDSDKIKELVLIFNKNE